MLASELQDILKTLSRNEQRLLKGRFEILSAQKALILLEHLESTKSRALDDKYICAKLYGKEWGSEYSHLKDYFFKSMMSVCIGTKIVSTPLSNSPDYAANLQHLVSKELVFRGFFHFSYNAIVKCLTADSLDQLHEEMKILLLTRTIRSFGNQFLNADQLSHYSQLLEDATHDMQLIAKYSNAYKLIVNDESRSIAQTYGILMSKNKVTLEGINENELILDNIKIHNNKRLKSILCRVAILWYKSKGDYQTTGLIMNYYELMQKGQKGNQNEMGGIKFSKGLNYMMLNDFKLAKESFVDAIELFDTSNEKSFHAIYYYFIIQVIEKTSTGIKKLSVKIQDWKIDQSNRKRKYYDDWKMLVSAITDYCFQNYKRAYEKLQGLGELYNDRFGWRLTIKYIEILCIIRIGDYDAFIYKHDSFRKYYYLLQDLGEDYCSIRIIEFYRFLGVLKFKNGKFCVPLSYSYKGLPSEWNPIGWEFIELGNELSLLKKC